MIRGAILDTILTFLGQWWRQIVTALVLVPSVFLLGQCHGEKIGRQQVQHAVDVANARALQQQQRADALAANQRLTDQRASDTLERNLANAVANRPDSVPTARRLARACAQLRDQGSDTAALPQCR